MRSCTNDSLKYFLYKIVKRIKTIFLLWKNSVFLFRFSITSWLNKIDWSEDLNLPTKCIKNRDCFCIIQQSNLLINQLFKVIIVLLVNGKGKKRMKLTIDTFELNAKQEVLDVNWWGKHMHQVMNLTRKNAQFFLMNKNVESIKTN